MSGIINIIRIVLHLIIAVSIDLATCAKRGALGLLGLRRDCTSRHLLLLIESLMVIVSANRLCGHIFLSNQVQFLKGSTQEHILTVGKESLRIWLA
jgi:hypothetical protein